MATDTTLLQGEVIENPDHQDVHSRDVERLLIGFLRALLEEQQ